MSGRIEVEYTASQNPRVVGARRWLCPDTGKLYPCTNSRAELSSGYVRDLGGTWKNGRATVREVAVTIPPSPAHPQAYKADAGKPNWFLLMSEMGCAKALAGVVRVLSFAVRPIAQGGKGYTPHSWREVPEAKERYEAALYRHLNKVALGEELDDESGESHWYHIATNALFLAELHNKDRSQ